MKFKVGQLWKDVQQKRERHLKVIAIPNDLCVQVKNTKTGRKTVITQYRIKENPKRFMLIEDVKQGE